MIKQCLFIAFAVFQSFAYSQYELVWSDEFEGEELDLEKWTFDIGQGSWGWGNNELQYYTANPSNIKVQDGMLNITAQEEQYANANYTSSRIKTKDLYEFQYGKVHARISVPIGQGLWPAFWMLGANIDQVSWPQCGEIDIMEHVNLDPVIHGTHHYNNNGHVYQGGSTVCAADQFNVYSIEWTPNNIIWSLNGNTYYSADIGPNAISKEEFHNPFFFLLNLAVGGNWPGSPNDETIFPADMYVDYVRVYQDVSKVEAISLEKISIHPNPINHFAEISSKQEISEYKVIDLFGRIVCEAQNTSIIDASLFDSGLYIIYVSMSNGQKARETFMKI